MRIRTRTLLLIGGMTLGLLAIVYIVVFTVLVYSGGRS
jgi:hypothetical protein